MTSIAVTVSKPKLSHVFNTRVFSHLLFWSWNGIFVLFVCAGLAPYLLADFVRDTLSGLLPASFAVTLSLAILIPLVSTAVGIIWLRKRPYDLLKLFYGIQLPLFLLCLGRVFLVRDLTAPVAFLGSCAAIGIAAFALDLRKNALARTKITSMLTLIAQTILLCATAYIGTLLMFYIVPVVWDILVEVLKLHWVDELFRTLFHSPHSFFFGGLLAILAAYSTTLFFALPVVAFILYFIAWHRSVCNVMRRWRPWIGRAITAVVCVAFVGVLTLTTRQPQGSAFAALAIPPSTDEERRGLLDDKEEIQDGLLNAYLAQYRYLSMTKGSNQIERIYANAFSGSREMWSPVQEAHDILAAPWLYQGESFHSDSRRAEELYEAFFDAPIQRGERDEVLAALNATWDRDSVEAGLLDQDAETVMLTEQALRVEEHGDWAEIEIHEVYENQTFEQQEVFYYFALPESAVASGLWLGDNDDIEKAFRFVVAPRGAAQSVYRNEVRRRVDPALLEQVGPQQYRLRIFPIPARDRNLESPTMRVHMWMRYRVLADDSSWPLPRLLERRNVFWTDETERTLDEQPLTTPGDGWLCPEQKARNPMRSAHDVVLSNGLRVRATPTEDVGSVTTLPPGSYVAVIVDRSYSMNEQAEAVAASIEKLEQTAGTARIDWYLTSSASRGEPASVEARVYPEELVYFGGQSTSQMLKQFEELSRSREYDAVILLTDASGYELEPETPLPLDGDSPLWLVHLGGELPIAYADPVVAVMRRTGGGIVYDIDELLDRLAVTKTSSSAHTFLRDGYLWEVEPTNVQPIGHDPFAPFAARAAIDALASTLSKRPTVDALDELHVLAREHEIVTAYSSMLVLVNDWQREELRRAAEADDRFDRESESGKERLTAPSGADLMVSGVPEPEEWALIGLGCFILLAWMYRRRRHLPALRAR